MKIQIHQIERDLSVTTDPPMFKIVEPLLAATFKQSGYGDPEAPAPFVERRKIPRRHKIGLIATPTDDHHEVVTAMAIEQDTGHHPVVQNNFPGYLERWRADNPGKRIFLAGQLFRNLKYWDQKDVSQAAGLCIVAAFDVMLKFGVHIGVIVINPDEHEKIYQRLGFEPVAEVKRMKGMGERARGLLMKVTPETRQDFQIERVRKILQSRA